MRDSWKLPTADTWRNDNKGECGRRQLGGFSEKENEIIITSVTIAFYKAINNFYDELQLAMRDQIMFGKTYSLHLTKSSTHMKLKSLQ